MANCVDHTESNFERLEREDKEKALRAELRPRLLPLEGHAVMYYDVDDKTHFGYLIKVGEVNCAVQPLAAINGVIPQPIRVDIINVKPEAIMTRLATLDEYLKSRNFDVTPAAPKQLDPKVKKERKAKVKIQPDEAVKVKKAAEEKTPAKPKPTEAEIHAALGSAITKFGNACKNGHLYVIDNIYITTLMNKGKLGCKECDKIRKGKQ